MVDISSVPGRLPSGRSSRVRARARALDAELVAVAAVLATALAIGLLTAGDYGVSVDEFNTDDYGPKALAWYTSGFVDRSHFETVEQHLWMYGPWFQMLTAFMQSLHLADPIATRHAMTFVIGLAGLAAVVPIARLAIGRWAGLAALTLCLLTGYLYGNLFFAPIDTPFLFCMSWATAAIVAMTDRPAPGWGATLAAGLFTGLAIATRTGGIITHAYLAGAMGLSALAVVLQARRDAPAMLRAIALRTAAVVVVAWVVAIALWPWLQIGNPIAQFAAAYVHFANLGTSFEFLNWGQETFTDRLPWWYIGGQLLVRLPEGFLLLLFTGIAFGLAAVLAPARAAITGPWRHDATALRAAAGRLVRWRPILVVAAAAFAPIAFLIVQGSALYDGLRHILFTLPMLALVAAAGLIRLVPLLRRAPFTGAAIGGAHAACLLATLVILHPLEYVAMNAVAGGVPGAHGRFELDYWSLAVPEALRRLEQRVDAERASGRFARMPPRVLVCIGWREQWAGVMFRRGWTVETDPHRADYLIATERWPCADGMRVVLVDEVQRFGRGFAWIYARKDAMTGR